MGWLFTYGQSKTDLIRHLTTTNLGGRMVTLAHCVRGNVLWTVHEYTDQVPELAGKRWIGCYLIAAQHVADFRISSDGNRKDFDAGVALCAAAEVFKADVPLDHLLRDV